MKTPARIVAFGGMMAGLAVVVMCLGGMIPVATYICPMICILILHMVLKNCGKRIAWAWYGAVAILSMLLGPDKEAAAVFLFLGYYPILKPGLDRMKFGLLFKVLLFNVAVFAMYWLLINLMGMQQIATDYQDMGKILTAVMLILGNVTFFMADFILSRFDKRR